MEENLFRSDSGLSGFENKAVSDTNTDFGNNSEDKNDFVIEKNRETVERGIFGVMYTLSRERVGVSKTFVVCFILADFLR